jgi:hypothetical protein
MMKRKHLSVIRSLQVLTDNLVCLQSHGCWFKEILLCLLKYTLMPHQQNEGQNHNIKMANTSFGNVVKFKYYGMTLTNLNCTHNETKIRIIQGMLGIIQSRSFCIPVGYLNTYKLTKTNR